MDGPVREVVMRHLRTFKLAVCVQALAVAMFGSTITQEAPVLLYETNYKQGVGLSGTDAPLFRHFYHVAPNSPRFKKASAKPDAIVAPFETPPLRDGFSGSFIFDARATQWNEFASRITDHQEQLEAEGLRLHVGLSAAPDNPVVGSFGSTETTLGIFDSPLPGSTLRFVRIDVNEWQVSDGVVTYDVNISYWGQPASDSETVAGIKI